MRHWISWRNLSIKRIWKKVMMVLLTTIRNSIWSLGRVVPKKILQLTFSTRYSSSIKKIWRVCLMTYQCQTKVWRCQIWAKYHRVHSGVEPHQREEVVSISESPLRITALFKVTQDTPRVLQNLVITWILLPLWAFPIQIWITRVEPNRAGTMELTLAAIWVFQKTNLLFKKVLRRKSSPISRRAPRSKFMPMKHLESIHLEARTQMTSTTTDKSERTLTTEINKDPTKKFWIKKWRSIKRHWRILIIHMQMRNMMNWIYVSLVWILNQMLILRVEGILLTLIIYLAVI